MTCRASSANYSHSDTFHIPVNRLAINQEFITQRWNTEEIWWQLMIISDDNETFRCLFCLSSTDGLFDWTEIDVAYMMNFTQFDFVIGNLLPFNNIDDCVGTYEQVFTWNDIIQNEITELQFSMIMVVIQIKHESKIVYKCPAMKSDESVCLDCGHNKILNAFYSSEHTSVHHIHLTRYEMLYIHQVNPISIALLDIDEAAFEMRIKSKGTAHDESVSFSIEFCLVWAPIEWNIVEIFVLLVFSNHHEDYYGVWTFNPLNGEECLDGGRTAFTFRNLSESNIFLDKSVSLQLHMRITYIESNYEVLYEDPLAKNGISDHNADDIIHFLLTDVSLNKPENCEFRETGPLISTGVRHIFWPWNLKWNDFEFVSFTFIIVWYMGNQKGNGNVKREVIKPNECALNECQITSSTHILWKCKRCKSIWYCCSNHQKRHWKLSHSKHCYFLPF